MSMGMRDSLRFVLRERFARAKFLGILIGGAFTIMLVSFLALGAFYALVTVPKSLSAWVPVIWLGIVALLVQLWKMTYIHSRSHSR